MESIRSKFEEIVDLRHQGYVEHKLSDVLIIVMCAVLCGLDELGDIILFAQKRQPFFIERFGIERIPSKATLSRILNMIDGEAVGNVIVKVMKDTAGSAGNILAVDGKAIRRTSQEGNPHSALQILTAYLTDSGVVLGQKSIHKKTNEIPVFQEMLRFLDVSEKTITADAMHCQKETCREIVKRGGHYVFGLKENHKTLFDDVALFFEDAINDDDIETFRTIEKNAGRIEERICRKVTDLTWLEDREDWVGLQTIFEVRRIIQTKDKCSDETCYYISDLDKPVKELLQITRQHWKIESLHWMLDVVFSEDDCKIISENGHKTLNAFRKLALLIHKQFIAEHRVKSTIKAHLLSCLLDNSLLAQLCNNL
jgi:predicted transposase YbfD/YdcC